MTVNYLTNYYLTISSFSCSKMSFKRSMYLSKLLLPLPVINSQINLDKIATLTSRLRLYSDSKLLMHSCTYTSIYCMCCMKNVSYKKLIFNTTNDSFCVDTFSCLNDSTSFISISVKEIPVWLATSFIKSIHINFTCMFESNKCRHIETSI